MLSPIHKSYRSKRKFAALTPFAWKMFGFGLAIGVAASLALFNVFMGESN
ncbi:hypothetical protein [Pseudobacteriovorax antillogorgiicola]|uniref:Uncharacterized protein n=1 Tax=Pseudobacteriovorax antillogorgiicola TaxID=1513793 RepID=A0A1Y6CPV7_9BACT|nr:hypothetical protein [Pseudobacteriovorax antillogorgiicola]TCS44233.1 hypothetical protein EDD56_13433 [Pseudobacteriovorax antillogorgiicola]SMF80647.1 hypothetical protein SAMN06296036_13534 [Pseudobacteriovorax antillogorgiicola]